MDSQPVSLGREEGPGISVSCMNTKKCKRMLWGLKKQGTQCSECGLICHAHCQTNTAACHAKTQVSKVVKASTALLSVYASQGKDTATTTAATTTATVTTATTTADTVLGTTTVSGADSLLPLKEYTPSVADTLDKVKHMLTSQQFQNVLVSAALHASDETQPVNDYLAHLPPLNPQSSAKNFSRFVSRCGPMFAARDTLLLLLSWHRPLETMLALVTYCCVCLSPGLLLLAPCTVLLHWMTLTHEKRFGLLPTPPHANTSVSLTTPFSPVLHNAPSPRTSASTPARDVSSPKPTGTFPLPFTSSFFLPMDEASPEYLKNLQNLQNMMGEMSDLYDAVYARVHHFDWSSETEATRLFQGLLLVTAGVACVVALVPFRYLALGGGVSLFIANTRFVKYIVKQMMPQVLVIGQLHLESVMANYEALEQQLENQMAVVEVSLYEHQKTQEAGGDGSVLVSEEKGPWSNSIGVEMPSPETQQPPKGYQWVESEWSIDKSKTWVDDVLGLERRVDPDEDGWVDTSGLWQSCTHVSKDTLTSTRRRRWVRRCEKQVLETK